MGTSGKTRRVAERNRGNQSSVSTVHRGDKSTGPISQNYAGSLENLLSVGKTRYAQTAKRHRMENPSPVDEIRTSFFRSGKESITSRAQAMRLSRALLRQPAARNMSAWQIYAK